MEKRTKMEKAEEEETLASMARFHYASRRMLQRCQHRKAQRNETCGNNESFGPSCLQRDRQNCGLEET